MSALARDIPFFPQDAELIPMRRRHLRQVLRIESEVYPRPWSAGLFLQEMSRRRDRVYLVARLVGDVVGYGGLMTTGAEAHVTTIAVAPEAQQHRLGTKIMLGLTDAAVEREAASISLEVRKSNFPAQHMYERFGFKPVGLRRGYYVETGEDAIVMWVDGISTSAYAAKLDTLRQSIEDWTPDG
jgi:[ribosomal protein S18]-alanine N-acetyltransferase